MRRVDPDDPGDVSTAVGRVRGVLEGAMSDPADPIRPTPDRPALIGLLVDVSGSMATAIENRGGRSITRLESFRDALEHLVKEAGDLSRHNSSRQVLPLLKLFAYGFGFGGMLSVFFGNSGPDVRDLLELPGERTSTIPLDRLVNEWERYRSHVEGLAPQMLGRTPMGGGFTTVHQRFRQERARAPYTGSPILFVLSDGDPTDVPAADIATRAAALRDDGIIIVTCYVTSENVTEPRRLYGRAEAGWPAGAKLMLECASVLPSGPFAEYLREYHWTVDQQGRLFTQVNQSAVLSEFMSVILSPLREQRPALGAQRKIRVFVSYSHSNSEYLGQNGLLGFLRGLEPEGFEFWHDERLVAGDAWDASIRRSINDSDIALVLVSQAFLNSDYCKGEVSAFLERRQREGLVIFPVIVSPCDWKSHGWLASTQFEPRNGQTIETHYQDQGSRHQLYLTILQQLRTIAGRLEPGP
jgi:hypothetical protein